MLVASMIVKVNSEKAEQISKELDGIENLTSYGVHKEDNIIIVAETETVDELEELSKNIINEYPDVIGVFPTYLASDEAEASD